jgi:hypothetical protein
MISLPHTTPDKFWETMTFGNHLPFASCHCCFLSSRALSATMDASPVTNEAALHAFGAKRKRLACSHGKSAVNDRRSPKLSRIALGAWEQDAFPVTNQDSLVELQTFPFISHDLMIARMRSSYGLSPRSTRRSRLPSALCTILENSAVVGSESEDSSIHDDHPGPTPWEEESVASFQASLMASEQHWTYAFCRTRESSLALPDSLARARTHLFSSHPPSSSSSSSLSAILASASKISPLSAANQLAFARSVNHSPSG